MTLTEIFNDFKNQLQTIYDERESDNISDWVFEKVTGLKKWERRNNPEIISESNQQLLQQYLSELLTHKPVQQVLHEAWFYKRKFYVNEHVLIPRPETEELVEWIVKDWTESKKSNNNKNDANYVGTGLLDIGTGSGCIPISLKKELPNLEITSLDISEDALKVAQKNAENLCAAINFLVLNFLDESEWKTLSEYDIIVSNPPYIPVAEKEKLNKNVTAFEPGVALFVSDNDPFIFYKKIMDFAKTHLKKSGKIYVEIHEEYASEVTKLFADAGFNSILKEDIYGKPRMIRAQFIEQIPKQMS